MVVDAARETCVAATRLDEPSNPAISTLVPRTSPGPGRRIAPPVETHGGVQAIKSVADACQPTQASHRACPTNSHESTNGTFRSVGLV